MSAIAWAGLKPGFSPGRTPRPVRRLGAEDQRLVADAHAHSATVRTALPAMILDVQDTWAPRRSAARATRASKTASRRSARICLEGDQARIALDSSPRGGRCRTRWSEWIQTARPSWYGGSGSEAASTRAEAESTSTNTRNTVEATVETHPPERSLDQSGEPTRTQARDRPRRRRPRRGRQHRRAPACRLERLRWRSADLVARRREAVRARPRVDIAGVARRERDAYRGRGSCRRIDQ